MALSAALLEDEILKLLDKDHPSHVTFPTTFIGAVNNWVTAFDTYASQVVPVSTTSAAAKLAFIAVLSGGSTPPTFLQFLEQAVASYCATLSLGMQPGFTATPPAGFPVISAPLLALPLGQPVSVIANMITIAIDTYIRTGIAVNNSTSVSTNWN